MANILPFEVFDQFQFQFQFIVLPVFGLWHIYLQGKINYILINITNYHLIKQLHLGT